MKRTFLVAAAIGLALPLLAVPAAVAVLVGALALLFACAGKNPADALTADDAAFAGLDRAVVEEVLASPVAMRRLPRLGS